MPIQFAKLFSLKSDTLVLNKSHQHSYIFSSIIDQEGSMLRHVVDFIRSYIIGYGNRAAFSILRFFPNLETLVEGKTIG